MGDAEGSIYGALDGVSLGLSFSEDEGSVEGLSDGTLLGLSLGDEEEFVDGLSDGALLRLSHHYVLIHRRRCLIHFISESLCFFDFCISRSHFIHKIFITASVLEMNAIFSYQQYFCRHM